MVKHQTTELSGSTIKIAVIATLIAALVLTGAATASKTSVKTQDSQLEAKKKETKEKNGKEKKVESVTPQQPNPAKEKLQFFLAEGDIPEEKMYVGAAGRMISNPRSIDYTEVAMATSPYRELKERKLGPNSGAYWLLVAEAGDIALREVIKYAKKQGITLITDRENLVKFLKKQERFKNNADEELIGWFDITGQIKEVIKNLDE
ncbi:MAG: hypothetical protein WCT16_02275 [Candidatus Buchananbacteria bacterium]